MKVALWLKMGSRSAFRRGRRGRTVASPQAGHHRPGKVADGMVVTKEECSEPDCECNNQAAAIERLRETNDHGDLSDGCVIHENYGQGAKRHQADLRPGGST